MDFTQFFAQFGGWIIGLLAGAISTIITVVVTHRTKKELNKKDEAEKNQAEKNQQLEKLLQEKKDEQFKNWVLKEMEPVVNELHHIEAVMEEKQEEIRAFHNEDEEQTRVELQELALKVKAIIHSYKFRIIRLCNIHLDAGWISTSDFEQLSELYSLYTRLGGNGQAETYYNKVAALPNSPEDEE